MKIAILLSILTVASALAEDVTVETSKTATEANREQQRKLEAQRRAKKALEESPITYSGFLVDLSRAERKSRFFSLRQPADPKNDYKHIYLDERTARPKGFILFSLDF
jgi:hypothetical protein